MFEWDKNKLQNKHTMACAMKREALTWYLHAPSHLVPELSFVRGVNHVL